MDERINTGYEFPKKTLEQARRSQAHWWGMDPDEWWAYCQAAEKRASDYRRVIEAENDFGRLLR